MTRIKILRSFGLVAVLSLLAVVSGALWRERLRYRRLAVETTVGAVLPLAAESMPELRFQDADLEHRGAARYD
jgi:hypothetical protein